jgi:hypothetical protein
MRWSAVCGVALLAGACAPRTDVAPAPSVLVAEGPLLDGAAAGGWAAVTAYDGWNRVLVAGATVHCHETADSAATDSAGRAWLRVPDGPFTVTGAAPGFGLCTVTAATTAHVGLPLPALAPRTVGVRGTVTGIVDATASRVEVPEGRGGLDPLLGTTPSDTYQLTMATGRNFRVTALEIGASGLRNLVISPVEWKLPPHKTVGTVDLAFPGSLPTIATCNGSLSYPSGFVAAITTVIGRVRTDLQDAADGEGVVVGWGTIGGFGGTFALDHAPAVTASLSPTDRIIDALAVGGSGDFTRARLPHATALVGGDFPSSASLTFPPLPYPVSPTGTTGVGLTPALQWTATVAAGAGAYVVTLQDLAGTWRWECWVPGGTATCVLPALPPALAASGPAVGAVVQWDVRGWHCPAFGWTAASLRRLALDATGETRSPAATFTP